MSFSDRYRGFVLEQLQRWPRRPAQAAEAPVVAGGAREPASRLPFEILLPDNRHVCFDEVLRVMVPETGDAREYVLVVDDEPGVRRFASRVLAAEGFGVHEATDGASALELLRAGGIDPAVVVSDIVMPRLNGVQLLQTLSSDRPDLPVILMSGFATAELTQRGIALPCGVLAKPFPPELLVSEVRRCIRRQLT